MLSTLAVSHVSDTKLSWNITKRKNCRNFGDRDLFYELSYVLLKGDFIYSLLSEEGEHKVKLKAYWTRVTCRVMENGCAVLETSSLEGPVSPDLQRAKEFCDFLSRHSVFPDHLACVFEDKVISARGGLDYSTDFDQAAKRLLRNPRWLHIESAEKDLLVPKK